MIVFDSKCRVFGRTGFCRFKNRLIAKKPENTTYSFKHYAYYEQYFFDHVLEPLFFHKMKVHAQFYYKNSKKSPEYTGSRL